MRRNQLAHAENCCAPAARARASVCWASDRADHGFFSIAQLWGGGHEEQQAVGELAGEGAVWLLQADRCAVTNWSAIFALWMVMYFSITSVRDRARPSCASPTARALQVAELRLISAAQSAFLFNSLTACAR